MYAAHEEARVADHRFAAFGRAPVNGHGFENLHPVADYDAAAHLRLERKILRVTAEHRVMSDGAVFSNRDVCADERVCVYGAAFAEHRAFLDDCKWSDGDARAEDGLRMDDCARMDAHGALLDNRGPRGMPTFPSHAGLRSRPPHGS